MPIAISIKESMEKSSWIRKMFEEGAKLKAQFGADKVFDFSLGNPDLDPPAEFFRLFKELSASTSKGIHGYMPNAGYPDVRKIIAEKISSQQNTSLTADSVIMTCGAAGGLNVALKTILNAGDEVIVLRPYFVEYGFYVSNHGGKIVFADTNRDFSISIENIKKVITDKTRAIIINSPNNPTGKIYSSEEIKKLAELLSSHNTPSRVIYLLADEPYREIIYDGALVPSLMDAYDHTIVVNSYSKSLSIPGERIGYIAASPQCADLNDLMAGMVLCNRILGFVNAPALMQRIVAGLTEAKVDVDSYKRRRDILVNGLKEAGYTFTVPGGAFYVFCEAPGGDDVKYVQHLQTYNILTVPGVGFGGPGYFRICYCVAEDTISRAIPKFKEALASWK